jgi:protein AroM
MVRVLGAVTIGQSPRIDVIPELRTILGVGADVIEAGALDGLTLEEVKRLAPGPGDHVLVTRMADGAAVKIAGKHILPLMQEKIDGLVGRGADVVALLCTGEFPEFRCDKLLVVPQKVMLHVATAVVEGFRLGVMLPDADQVPQGIRRWSAVTLDVFIEPASPYGNPEAVDRAARRLRERGVGAIVMDCIGYTLAMKEKVREITGAPVILARSILARVLAELA